jgi:hypothetical protein
LCFFGQDEFSRIIFCDDDRKNIMGVKRVCNFAANQLLKVDPNTAMTEADWQQIVETFHTNFTNK